MSRTTRTVVVASLALAALTGCGGAAAEARGSHTYEPLPPLSTATPSPTPKAISSPSPKASPTPSPTPSASSAEAPEGGFVAAGVPGQTAGAAGAPAPVPGPVAAPAPVPAPVSGPAGGGAPGQMTERTSSSTTTVTSTTLEARVQIVVTCEGQCMLDDLAAPELTGGDGPVSPDLLRRALEEELGGRGGDQQQVTDELIEQLMTGDWDLADTLVQGGDEKLVFSSARK